MKRLTTILCALAFMVSGILLTNMTVPQQNQLYAAQPPIIIQRSTLPLDLQLDLAKHDSENNRTDTIIQHDTVHVVKYKIKYRAPKKTVEPDSLSPVVAPDTSNVSMLNILIRMSEDVLMDTTIIVKPVNDSCPKIQPLRECKE